MSHIDLTPLEARVGESVSSLLDDHCEAEDLDFLLEQEAQTWQKTMQSYAYVSKVMQSKEAVADVAEFDLVARVSLAIATEPVKENSIDHTNVVDFASAKAEDVPLKNDSAERLSWRSAMGGLAIAASVAFVVVLGGNTLLDTNNIDAGSSQLVAVEADFDVGVELKQLEIASLDVHNERLQSYLRQHAEQATMAAGQGMIPMARVVSYSIEH